MDAADQALNRLHVFHPQRSDDQRPAVQIFNGPLIFTYVRDGELVITVDTEEMDRPPLPVRVNVNSATVWAGTVVGLVDADACDHAPAALRVVEVNQCECGAILPPLDDEEKEV